MKRLVFFVGWLLIMDFVFSPSSWAAEMGKFTYDDFKKPALRKTPGSELHILQD
ncbi:MAG: hypothetical protein JW883_07775 [Deltaproteobacteria bacterium]|nr:hypothetical protein [Deltaproteobacteria bacterium]